MSAPAAEPATEGGGSISSRPTGAAPRSGGGIEARGAPPAETSWTASIDWLHVAWILATLIAAATSPWLIRRSFPEASGDSTRPDLRSAKSLEPSAMGSPPPTVEPAPKAMLFKLGSAAETWELVAAASKGLAAVQIVIDRSEREALPMRTADGFQLYDVSPDHPLIGTKIGAPLFAYVPAAGSAGEIVRVPLPWREQAAAGPTFEIAASTNEASSFGTASAVKDPSITTILGYMSSGRLREAELLVRDAERFLDHKQSSPMGAITGAYVLLASCKGRAGGRNWRPLIEALYRELPFADGAILHGWNLLQQQEQPGDLDHARACFLEAISRGLPVYLEGARLLQSGLAMFGRGDAGDELASAIAKADALATRCNPSQAFTSIKVSCA